MSVPELGARNRGAPPYCFDDVVVDPAAHSLVRAGIQQHLEPKAFAVLLALLQRPGELIGHEELLDLAWGHRHVTPGVLTRAVAQLRHALKDDAQKPRYILTRHALGYSFVGLLQPRTEGTAAPAPIDETVEVGVPTTLDTATDSAPALPTLEREGAQPLQRPRLRPPVSAWGFADASATGGPSTRRRLKYVAWQFLTLLLGVLLISVIVQRVITSHPNVAASIAVMPFTNLGGNRDDDYFAEGLTEEMRDALAGVQGLKVAASVSPAARKGAVDAKALGARLGVATILDANVRREGSRIRITARLSDTTTGFTLWSHTYDRKITGVFATQTEIADEVVRALLGAQPGEDGVLVKRLIPTQNEAAFDIYLQGRHLLRDPASPENVDQAIQRFGDALQRDSGFAKAQAGICRAETWRFQSKHSSEAFNNAWKACDRAAKMDPSLAEVDLALGDLYRVAGDFTRALAHYRKSALAPARVVSSRIGMAQVYAAQGRHDLATNEFQLALEQSPGNGAVYANIGYQQYLDGKPHLAVASYRRALELKPDDAELWGTLGALYLEAGNNADAVAALERAIAIAPSAATLTNLGLLRYQAGAYAAAAELQRQATVLDPQDFMIWGNLADALRADPTAKAGEQRQAFAQAAARAQSYLKIKPDDARAVAALAFYQLMLGDAKRARQLIKQSESLPGQAGEVALLNAETLALLGEIEPARKRLALARTHGIADTLINSNLTFRRLHLLRPAAGSGKHAAAGRAAPRESTGQTTGGKP